ncbi:hypothetical protein [uncultured Nonlabens sp.]|uniref:hypothetical protein n=1 Tax=uncultured Nonlabens sp. TaxID=859306 RepID=UPI00261B19F0|nr:hypothetical protein [uncultured Nonlabens sp.]
MRKLVFASLAGVFMLSSGFSTFNDSSITLTTDSNSIDMEKVELIKECHLVVKGTIDGKEIDLDITFTSDSGSCIKDSIAMVKEIAANK